MSHLGIIGKGAIVRALLPLLAGTSVERVTLLVRPTTEANGAVVAGLFGGATRVVSSVSDLLSDPPDLVVEAAGQAALCAEGVAILQAGIPLVAASVGALADSHTHEALLSAAKIGQSRLHIPSGAIGGIDALAALSSIGPVELTYTGTKPPQAWPGSDVPAGVLFEGTARQAAITYPKNANVAATLALAGPGLDATRVVLVSDSDATGNSHAWRATSPAGDISMVLRNAPVAGNAATSLLTVHSLLRTIRNLTSEVSL